MGSGLKERVNSEERELDAKSGQNLWAGGCE